MKILNYYTADVIASERSQNESFDNDKIYSIYKINHQEPMYLENILWLREEYPADVKLPQKHIEFYEFKTWKSVKKLDDFMRTIEINPSLGFFVSPKAKEILKEFILPNHRYYPVNIIHKEETYSYYFLLIAIDNQPIQYSKSIFIDWMNDDTQLHVDSLQDLLEQKDGNPYFPETPFSLIPREYIREKKIVLSHHFDIYKEIFGIDLFFSEKLKQRIEQEGLTGLEFKEQTKIEFYLEDTVESVKIEEKNEIAISTLLPEPLKLLSPTSPYKLPPEISQIEVNEQIKDKGQILTANLFSYYLENEQQMPYKVENIKIQLTSINKSKKLYTFENIEPFMVIFNEKAQHFPKNMKIIIKQENVKIV
ncbi:hypothetical protein AD998_14455 [bacterium 336/3]|nr:hypothetical protein AD998_14455 [bacterium 336/3]